MSSSSSVNKRLVMLGPPGAGKGTQAKILADKMGISHISSGDLFRRHREEGTRLGLRSVEYMRQGLLVPDEVTIEMVLDQIKSPSSSNGFLLDGFPRNLTQAQALDEASEGTGQEVDLATLINVPLEELVKRLIGRRLCRQCQAPYHREYAPPKTPGKCNLCRGELYQRQDDTPDAVRVRIQVYEDETRPLVGYYNKDKKLVEVDGVGTVNEVAQRLLQALE